MGGGGDRERQSMLFWSMSPRDATCLLSSCVTPCPAAPRRHKRSRDVEQRTSLMYPELMFNESSIFRQVHAKTENGFVVLLWKVVCVCVCVCVWECKLVHLYFESAESVRPVFTSESSVLDKSIY